MTCVKIGLYARVSTEKQAQEKAIESQVATILDYVESKQEKIEPDLHFIDDGFSGASLERPGLDRLRDKALAGEVSKVYVLAPDRLSRKSAHQILLIEEMKRLVHHFLSSSPLFLHGQRSAFVSPLKWFSHCLIEKINKLQNAVLQVVN